MKAIKKILLVFCVAFTVVTLFSSFSRNEKIRNYFFNMKGSSFAVDEVTHNGQKYIIATTPDGGIAICKE